MSTCDDIRRRLLSEPDNRDREIGEHLAQCAACRDYAQRLQGFELQLQRALKIDLPPASAKVIDLTARRPRAAPLRWLALAASLLVAAGVVGLWASWPAPALARDVVLHLSHEPNAWTSGPAPVAGEKLDAVMQNAGVKLKSGSPTVSYASSCEFRGRIVPHLVVQTPQGPVTVMILSHETVKSAMPFDEQGYRGSIVPVPGHGSIAVITRTKGMALGPITHVLMQELIWLPGAG